ncbi:hypothetical protein GOEFS_108_00020 [Gordonia effusa NBRC 100432]|uniref:Uncharacterized protein n=1 Tax=Gordonia effusa NBRC 100432 TaxID=1077974 RepID=H0R591_9ACTN|nr:hypothetical protein [Gordonia effusa]GAB20242.1 hypothetical protein GOEFS_108_00020 [Gordonia effusa NBRC 100432]
MSNTSSEGWGVIRPTDRKAHYYRNGRSLCGRVGFYFGELDADTGAVSTADCAACSRKLHAIPLTPERPSNGTDLPTPSKSGTSGSTHEGKEAGTRRMPTGFLADQVDDAGIDMTSGGENDD